MNTACVLYVTWKQACFQLWLNISDAAYYSWAVMGIPANSSSFPRSLKSPHLLVRAPNLPGNTYHGLFQFFFSLISLFWRYQKRKIKQEVDLALLFELFSIGKCITEHRHWLEINQSNWTIHGRKLERFSNAVIDIGNIQKAFGWFSENS